MAAPQIFILTICLFHILSQNNSNAANTISNPRITNWGQWGAVDSCPRGTYVHGFELKVQSSRGARDDTGLNGLRLFCDKPGRHGTSVSITSSIGPYGDWRSPAFCDGLLTGFQLRIQEYMGKGIGAYDDTAANNFRGFCSNGKEIEGDGMDWGTWRSGSRCHANQAVCGIKTQVEDGSDYDDTGLNNIELICCNIIDESVNCQPSTTWVLVHEYDNSRGRTDITTYYRRVTGVSRTDRSFKSGSKESSSSYGMDSSIGGSYYGIASANLAINFQKSKSFRSEWGSETMGGFTEETTVQDKYITPAHNCNKVLQLVGYCGPYQVKFRKFKIDEC